MRFSLMPDSLTNSGRASGWRLTISLSGPSSHAFWASAMVCFLVLSFIACSGLSQSRTQLFAQGGEGGLGLDPSGVKPSRKCFEFGGDEHRIELAVDLGQKPLLELGAPARHTLPFERARFLEHAPVPPDVIHERLDAFPVR